MKKAKYKLVLIRHGHTEWNLTNRFTGWSDVPLSDVGISEAEQAGLNLAAEEISFDEAHISTLVRTRQTLDAILNITNHPEIPVCKSWRLNERHYGCLQGMNKQAIFKTWGEDQSYRWWRGYEESPPPLDHNDPQHPRFDPQYNDIHPDLLPVSESLLQCKERLVTYWDNVLRPAILSGKQLIVVSHGNTLRGLRMHVENMNPTEIEKIEIPSGVPFVYHFNDDMSVASIDWLEQTSASSPEAPALLLRNYNQ